MIDIIPVISLKEFQLPKKQRIGDAGFDVFATSRRITDRFIEYGLGFRTDMPMGIKGVIVPRSSISNYDLIMCNSPAQIDSGYKYEWMVRFKLTNSSDTVGKIYDVGDRIAQIFFEQIFDADISNVEEPSINRDGGFGHSGL